MRYEAQFKQRSIHVKLDTISQESSSVVPLGSTLVLALYIQSLGTITLLGFELS